MSTSFYKKVLITLIASTSLIGGVNAEEQCAEGNIHKVRNFPAEGDYSYRYDLFMKDVTLKKNRGISKEQKISRIVKAIRISDSSPFVQSHGAKLRARPASERALALKIEWAAKCTGNDFSMLTGIIGHESAFCVFAKNLGGGTDAGCGQFTAPAIEEVKNALQLPGKTMDISEMGRVKEAYINTISKCAPGSSYVDLDRFVKVFSMPTEKILKYFTKRDNLSLEILAAALVLKTHFVSTKSKKGFYYSKTDEQGALTRYNGGGVKKYGYKVNEYVKTIDAVSCKLNEDDRDYLREIEGIACEVSEDRDACYMSVETYEI